MLNILIFDTLQYAIQDWREDGEIIMKHISGIIDPSGDLLNLLAMSCILDIVIILWDIILNYFCYRDHVS